MKLDNIIKKSRSLVNKLYSNSGAKFTQEDYFMISVSLFVARKESIIKKNNKNNTLYFDYKKYNKDFLKMKIIFDELLLENQTIIVDIPSIGRFDLTKKDCFKGIKNLSFPFNQKIEIENFEGTEDELNEVKRYIWLYSKLRDSFVHGDKFRFDIQNNKIIIKNNVSNELLGEFKFEVTLSPEVLNFLCGQKYEPENIFYGHMDSLTYARYNLIYDKMSQEDKEDLSKDILEDLYEEIDEIQDPEELKLIAKIINLYRRTQSKMTKQQSDKYFEKIVEIIVTYAGRSRANDQKSRKLFSYLSETLTTENNIYYAALYSHMVFVFANTEQINSDNLRTKNIKVKDDMYSKIIKKTIITANNAIENLMNGHIDAVRTRDVIVENINRIMELMRIRNRWILNNLRNGIEHKNINVDDEEIEIFNKADNKSEDGKVTFSCTTTFEQMDDFLLGIETNEEQEKSLNIDEFIDELFQICGPGKHVLRFAEYLKTFEQYITNRNESNGFAEDDEPPKF